MNSKDDFSITQDVTKGANVDLLNDAFRCNIYTLQKQDGSNGDILGENEPSYGDYTNIKGILLRILDYIKRMKCKTDGNHNITISNIDVHKKILFITFSDSFQKTFNNSNPFIIRWRNKY